MEQKIRKANKDHECYLCNSTIRKGSKYLNITVAPWSNPDNFGFGHYKGHIGCWTVFDEMYEKNIWFEEYYPAEGLFDIKAVALEYTEEMKQLDCLPCKNKSCLDLWDECWREEYL